MLDFIVLGIVPGTSFVVTLNWVLIFALVLCLLALLVIEVSNRIPKTDRPLTPAVNLDGIGIGSLLNTIYFIPGHFGLFRAKKD